MNKIFVRYGKVENKLFMLLEQYLSGFYKKNRHELDKYIYVLLHITEGI